MALINTKDSQTLSQGQNVALGDFSLLRCIHIPIFGTGITHVYALEKKKNSISNLVVFFLKGKKNLSMEEEI